MQLTKGFEQGACIIVLLATQEDGIPVTSHAINRRLQGSVTYLKKIIRKLVVAEIVTSIPGNTGGFTLAKEPQDINLYELVEALEGRIATYPATGLINEVFQDMTLKTDEKEKVIAGVFAEADELWKAALRKNSVFDLIRETLGTETLPKLNWNESTDSKGLLIQRVLKGVRDHD